MNNQTSKVESVAPSHRHRPLHVWIGLVGAVLIAVSMAVSWTGIRLDRREWSLTGWDILRLDQQLLRDLQEAQSKARSVKEKLKFRKLAPPTFPLRPNTKIGEPNAPDERPRPVAKLEKTAATIESYLQYAQIGFIGLLALALLQLLRAVVVQQHVTVVFSYLTGLCGIAFTGTLAALWVYVSRLELPVGSITVEAGYTLVIAASALLAVSGIIWAIAAKPALWLPLQAVPGIAWTAYFCYLLGIV